MYIHHSLWRSDVLETEYSKGLRDKRPTEETGLKTSLPLEGKFVLLVMGERENGHFLLRALVEKGAFLVIVCSPVTYPIVTKWVRQDALLREHCFLLSAALTHEQLAQRVIAEIAHIFGRIDIFIDYSAPPAKPGRLRQQTNGSPRNTPSVIPNLPLTVAVLGQMFPTG